MSSRQPMEQVPIPDAEKLDMKVPGEETFASIVQKRQDSKAQIDYLKVIIAECDVKIGSILDLNLLKNVVYNREWIVSRREASAPRKSVSIEKLLELGVPAEIIQKATVYSAGGRPGVVIRRVGERGSENGEPN